MAEKLSVVSLPPPPKKRPQSGQPSPFPPLPKQQPQMWWHIYLTTSTDANCSARSQMQLWLPCLHLKPYLSFLYIYHGNIWQSPVEIVLEKELWKLVNNENSHYIWPLVTYWLQYVHKSTLNIPAICVWYWKMWLCKNPPPPPPPKKNTLITQ